MRWLLLIAVALVVTPAANATFSIAITATTVTAQGVTLNGVDQTKPFTVAATEIDTSNTTGWNITAASTTLTSGAHTLPALIVTTVSSAACTGFRCVNPTTDRTWPLTLSATPVKIYNALNGTGTGTMVITGTFQVTYPANAFPGTYTATITLATFAGP
jgi:hypothetical protein